MSKPTHISVHLVPLEELPDDAEGVALFVTERAGEIRADLYCDRRTPAVARAAAPLLFNAVRKIQLAL